MKLKNVTNYSRSAEEWLKNFDILRIREKILSIATDDKEREILIRRFGLDDKEPETLESIGKSFRVTRERIRQIEKSILKNIGRSSVLGEVFSNLENYLSKRGGIVTNSELEKILKLDSEQARAIFRILLESSDKFSKIENPLVKKSWVLFRYSPNLLLNLITILEGILKDSKKIMSEGELINSALKETENLKNGELVDKEFTKAAIFSAKNIGKTTEGKFGLTRWGIVNPRNTRDKAYVVLRRVLKPLHFQELTERIKEAKFSKKMVSVEAVHNELIRDPRFVLVGRGIYALKEWGYKPGTVADVIEEILQKEGRPLHKNEIVKKVLEKRLVRKNTILLNLQEKPQFERVKRAVYKLKEKK